MKSQNPKNRPCINMINRLLFELPAYRSRLAINQVKADPYFNSLLASLIAYCQQNVPNP